MQIKFSRRLIMVYLEITLKVSNNNRVSAANVYTKYKEAFLKQIQGAKSKQLLVRNEDVQVLHGFDSVENANTYLQSNLFNHDVVVELSPYIDATPEIRIYETV